jgi:hypothetical protein
LSIELFSIFLPAISNKLVLMATIIKIKSEERLSKKLSASGEYIFLSNLNLVAIASQWLGLLRQRLY